MGDNYVIDVTGDGNCGCYCIAIALLGDGICRYLRKDDLYTVFRSMIPRFYEILYNRKMIPDEKFDELLEKPGGIAGRMAELRTENHKWAQDVITALGESSMYSTIKVLVPGTTVCYNEREWNDSDRSTLTEKEYLEIYEANKTEFKKYGVPRKTSGPEDRFECVMIVLRKVVYSKFMVALTNESISSFIGKLPLEGFCHIYVELPADQINGLCILYLEATTSWEPKCIFLCLGHYVYVNNTDAFFEDHDVLEYTGVVINPRKQGKPVRQTLTTQEWFQVIENYDRKFQN